MTSTTFSAPGKLILCGEYAVMDDAPAVVMAVDRRADVSITSHDEPWFVLTAPGYASGAWRFERHDDGRIKWLDAIPENGFPLIEAVLQQDEINPGPCAAIEVDTHAFSDSQSGRKFGLGSSAAATVALTAALSPPECELATLWNTARAAHRAMQGGSGADIAASCFAGLLQYRQSDEAEPQSMAWPEGLEYRVFYSGVAASTSAAIEQMNQRDNGDGVRRALAGAAVKAAESWQSGDAGIVLESMRDYRQSLQKFDDQYDLSIFAAGHAGIAELGDAHGVIYKPCGAGGGDCGIALSDNADSLNKFSDAAEARGFVPLEVRRDNRGV